MDSWEPNSQKKHEVRHGQITHWQQREGGKGEENIIEPLLYANLHAGYFNTQISTIQELYALIETFDVTWSNSYNDPVKRLKLREVN